MSSGAPMCGRFLRYGKMTFIGLHCCSTITSRNEKFSTYGRVRLMLRCSWLQLWQYGDMVYRTVGWNTWHMNSSTELIHELDHAMHIDFEHTRSFAIVKPIDSIAAIAGWSLRVEVAVSVVMMFMRPSKCLPVVYCILVFVSFHPCHNQ